MVYCDVKGCSVALRGLAYPNGILNLKTPNRFILPMSARPYQLLLELNRKTRKLEVLSKIPIGQPADNAVEAANGDVYAATFPNALATGEVMAHENSPKYKVASTVHRIPAADIKKKGKDGWHVEKVYGESSSARCTIDRS